MTNQELQEIVTFLEETPGHIRQLAAEMALQDLKWKPSVDEFSAVEQVCHLRDLERDYNSQDFESAFQEFALARAENVRVMKTLSPDQLNRSGVLEGVGAITLGKLFWLMREHDQSHREELSEQIGRASC